MMKKKLMINMLLTSAVALLPMLLGIALYSDLPDQVPTHWGFDGEINSWSGKNTVVFFMPIGMALLSILVQFMLENDPKKSNMSTAVKAISRWLCPVMSLIFVPASLLSAIGYDLLMSLIACLLVGAVLIIMGNYLPKSKQSYTVGIRLPWTLSSTENWNRTHRLAGKLWIFAGFCLIAAGIFTHRSPAASAAALVIVLIVLLVPSVYSFVLYKKGI